MINNLENILNKNVIEKIVDKRLPLGLKKILLFYSSNYSLALNSKNTNFDRLIQESRKQWYMDKLIPLLGERCPPEGEIKEQNEKEKLAKSIVFVLLQELKKTLKNYSSKNILFELMKNYESLIHKQAISKFGTPARLHCFSEREDIVAEIQKKKNINDETTLALRCLIEHLSSEPSFGDKQINQQVIDDMIVIMSLIISWGGMGDIVKYNSFDISLYILPSLRIGTNSHEILEPFFQQFSNTTTKEYIEDTIGDFSSYYVENERQEGKTSNEGFNNAFANEIGIHFDKLGGIANLLSNIGLEQDTPIARLSIAEIIIEVKKSFDEPFTDEEIKAGIKFLSLWNRKDVAKVPEGFKNIDISPWRYNRKLSYLQRPLILSDSVDFNEDSIIYWTPRHLDKSWNHLNYLFVSGRYRANEKSELERQMSFFLKKRTAVIQEEVVKWFNEQTEFSIYEEIEISPDGKLKSLTNIGDCDVFAIDHQKKLIFSIECKRTESAKNSKQMVEQVKQYFDSKKGYFYKHIRRHNWLESNLDKVGQVFNFNPKNYTIVSFFVTYEILAIQFMENKPLPIPMISLFELKNMDYKELKNHFIND